MNPISRLAVIVSSFALSGTVICGELNVADTNDERGSTSGDWDPTAVFVAQLDEPETDETYTEEDESDPEEEEIPDPPGMDEDPDPPEPGDSGYWDMDEDPDPPTPPEPPRQN